MESLPSVKNSAHSTQPIKTTNAHRKPTNSRAFLAAKKKNKFKNFRPSFASTIPSDDSSILSEQSPRNVSLQDVETNNVRTSSSSPTVPVSQAAGRDIMIQQARMSKTAEIDIMIQQAKMSKAAGIDSVIQQAKMSKAAGIGSVIQQSNMKKIGSVIQQAKMSKAGGVGSVIQQVKMSKAAGIDSVIQQAKMSKAAGIDIAIQQAKNHAVLQMQQDGCTGHFRSFDSQFGNFIVPIIPTISDLNK